MAELSFVPLIFPVSHCPEANTIMSLISIFLEYYAFTALFIQYCFLNLLISQLIHLSCNLVFNSFTKSTNIYLMSACMCQAVQIQEWTKQKTCPDGAHIVLETHTP